MTPEGESNQKLTTDERRPSADDELTFLEERARRVPNGILTREQARAQIAAKY